MGKEDEVAGKLIPFESPRQVHAGTDISDEKNFCEHLDPNPTTEERVQERWDGPLSLKPKHKLIFRLYGVLCWSIKDISECPETYLTSPSQIWRLINSVAGQNYLDQIGIQVDDEFKRMRTLYIMALKKGLTSQDARERLAAAGLYQKVDEKRQHESQLTAEDEIAAMMKDVG